MKTDLNTSLVLVNYKEPLVKVKKGHGYLGALRMTQDGMLVECHACGKLFADVGRHANSAHKMNAVKYRDKFELARMTSLVAEGEREARKRRSMLYWRSLSKEERAAHRRKSLQKYSEWLKKNKNGNKFKIRLETKNKRGSCPDQIAAQIQACAKTLGHTPSKGDFLEWSGSQRYLHLARSSFGSWHKAIKYAGLKPKAEYAHTKGKKMHLRSDDELLELLSLFHQETGRVPSHTDFKRGLLPSQEIYIRRFGSIPGARRMAGIRELPTGRWGGLEIKELTV